MNVKNAFHPHASAMLALVPLLLGCGGGNRALPIPTTPQVAFASNRSGNSEIYLMERDGYDPRRLTYDDDLDFQPSLTPDRRHVVFTRRSGSNYEIWRIGTDGRSLRRLASTPGLNADPAVSPDGFRVAFVSDRDGFDEIWVMDLDGRNVRQLTFDRAPKQTPAWSPDGGQIAYAAPEEPGGDTEIFTVRASDGGGRFQLTENDVTDDSPAWSPDGGRIAFASDRDGGFDIYSMDSWDGTELIKIVGLPGDEGNPVYGLDGDWLYFDSTIDGITEVWRMWRASAEVESLTEFTDGSSTNPDTRSKSKSGYSTKGPSRRR